MSLTTILYKHECLMDVILLQLGFTQRAQIDD